MYDVIIIGAGPAGISAGIYAVSRGKRALVLEKGQVGGIIGKVSTVTHYTALQAQETGETFAKRMKEQALNAGVEIAYANVTGVTLRGEVKTVSTDKGTYEARRIILANGGTPRKLGIPGEAELAGKGLSLIHIWLRHETYYHHHGTVRRSVVCGSLPCHGPDRL